MKKFVIDNGVLIDYIGNEFHVVIPDGVRRIGELAFCNCNSLTSIEIPNSVTEINNSAFYFCTSLTNIVIPESVLNINACAFYGCANLKSVNMPTNVAYIGCDAFADMNEVKPQYNPNGYLRAFKGFRSDWTCRGFKYAVGKSYHQDGKIKCCWNGFHACTNPLNVFHYYWGDLSKLRFAEVELRGKMDFDDVDTKVAASDIKIIRELTVSELMDIYNSMEKEK